MSQSFEFMVIVLIESNSEALKKHIICINPFVKQTIRFLKFNQGLDRITACFDKITSAKFGEVYHGLDKDVFF